MKSSKMDKLDASSKEDESTTTMSNNINNNTISTTTETNHNSSVNPNNPPSDTTTNDQFQPAPTSQSTTVESSDRAIESTVHSGRKRKFETHPNGSLATPNNITLTTLLNGREKRIRKQKYFDDEYVLFNINSSSSSTNSSIPIQTPYIEDAPIRYALGDLVWAKLTGHPWWPCMVTQPNDLDSNDTYVKYVGIGKSKPKRMFYVEFFGPSVEHAWVFESFLIEYRGVEAFKTFAQDQVDQALSKSAKEKLAERYQLKVALSKRDNWEMAVKEADVALNGPSSRKPSLMGNFKSRNVGLATKKSTLTYKSTHFQI
jgi:hypothetical protein